MQIRNDVKENQFKKNKYFPIFHSQEANFHNLEKFKYQHWNIYYFIFQNMILFSLIHMAISNLLKPMTDDNCYLPKQDF